MTEIELGNDPAAKIRDLGPRVEFAAEVLQLDVLADRQVETLWLELPERMAEVFAEVVEEIKNVDLAIRLLTNGRIAKEHVERRRAGIADLDELRAVVNRRLCRHGTHMRDDTDNDEPKSEHA